MKPNELRKEVISIWVSDSCLFPFTAAYLPQLPPKQLEEKLKLNERWGRFAPYRLAESEVHKRAVAHKSGCVSDSVCLRCKSALTSR